MRVFTVVMALCLAGMPVFAQEAAGTSLPAEWYQGKPIRDVVFNGLRHVDSSELEGIVEPYRGHLFDDDVFWELQGKLYALEYFDNITPTAVPADQTGQQVIIRFTVTERPVVSRITFTGNAGVRRGTLMDAVSIKVNDVLTQVKLHIAEAAVQRVYLEKGYPDVTVRSETAVGKDDSRVITFFIEEGSKTTISDIFFEGNSIFSTSTLRGQLTLKAKGWIGWINDGAFQEAKLLADRQALASYYHDRGYIDADVIDVAQVVEKDAAGNNNLMLTFKITEGKRYTFTGVTFEGNVLFSSDQLAALITSKTGDTVNAQRLEADLQKVADLYYENGYIFNSINRDELRDRENGTLSFNLFIVERPRAHIESIVIKGNKKTKDKVILREIPLEAGDVFSKTKVMDAWRNLYNLQYFSVVEPETLEGGADGLMDLVFTVEEQPTMDIQAGLTFSGSADPEELPISAMARWNDRNFLGNGNQLGVGVTLSTTTQSLTADYTQNWIFGSPLSVSFGLTLQHSRRTAALDNIAPYFNGNETYAYPDGFTSYEEYYNAGKLPPEAYRMRYDQWQIAPSISSGYRFTTPFGNLGVGGGVTPGFKMNRYDAGIFRPFDPALRDFNNKWIPAFTVGIYTSLDQRDIYYDPSRGYYFMQRLSYHGILRNEEEQYVRSDSDAEWFVTLFDIPVSDTWNFKAVFGIHSGLSFIFPNFRGRDNMSIENANKLAIDGMFTARGWADRYSDKGNALWENWAELRFPLVKGFLAWDFFFDAAEVKAEPHDLFYNNRIQDMYFSVGGAFRITIPQLPFRIGVAKRFHVEENGDVEFIKGALGGLDFVLSFTVPTY